MWIRKGRLVAYLSSEFGVATVTIYKWIKHLTSVKVSDNEEMTAKDYQAMKKRITELAIENEILIKSNAIFERKQ